MFFMKASILIPSLIFGLAVVLMSYSFFASWQDLSLPSGSAKVSSLHGNSLRSFPSVPPHHLSQAIPPSVSSPGAETSPLASLQDAGFFPSNDLKFASTGQRSVGSVGLQHHDSLIAGDPVAKHQAVPPSENQVLSLDQGQLPTPYAQSSAVQSSAIPAAANQNGAGLPRSSAPNSSESGALSSAGKIQGSQDTTPVASAVQAQQSGGEQVIINHGVNYPMEWEVYKSLYGVDAFNQQSAALRSQ